MNDPVTIQLGFNSRYTRISSLKLGTQELIRSPQGPIFSLALRDIQGQLHSYSALDSSHVEYSSKNDISTITYTLEQGKISVVITYRIQDKVIWNIRINNKTPYAIEYIDFPNISCHGVYQENGGDSAVLWPYNEGVLVKNSIRKPQMLEPIFPSQGNYGMFPYMVSAQFMLFLTGDMGLYMGVHDASRSPKGLDFCTDGNSTTFRTRLFMGCGFGECASADYDIVWEGFTGSWYDGAEIYRSWLENTLPENTKKVYNDATLPQWYREEMPVVVTYPVRGVHDMDHMAPNKLFPYCNALPHIDHYSKKFNSKIMALLMHWEGTAPWAPPYVWPPYGGEEIFHDFAAKLHDKGNLLGVYCSGFGFTEQSNLIPEYNQSDKVPYFADAFNIAPDGSMPHSAICTAQRSGYDICPASNAGKKLLNEALDPLLHSAVDYIQVLDQNHGGSMYFCYSKNHGHPPVPGQWMTEATANLLRRWTKENPSILFGCESAAAEPYIGLLKLSDNRYELNMAIGEPVPVYAFLYHEYLHNFMGNQIGSPFDSDAVNSIFRIAYSFLAGDLITLTLTQDGKIATAWGQRDFSVLPDALRVENFVAQCCSWHKKYPKLFQGGKMVAPIPYSCSITSLPFGGNYPQSQTQASVLSTAWQTEGKVIQFFANYTPEDVKCTLTLTHKVNFKTIDQNFCIPVGPVTISVPAESIVAIEFSDSHSPRNSCFKRL